MSASGSWIRHHCGLLNWFDCVVVPVVGESSPGGLFQPVLASLADGGAACFVLVEGDDAADACVQALVVALGANRVELGPEYGGVGDDQQVGSLGLERSVE